MGRLPPPFFAVSPGNLVADSAGHFAQRAQRAFEAGLPGLMLREADLCDRDFLALADLLRHRARVHGAWLCVHDRAHVALAVDADALHLGFRSLAPRDARAFAGEAIALGISTHAGDGPELEERCDYRVHGPVFDTPSKRGWKAPIGLEGIQRAARASELPLWAIGGLLPEHFAALREHGAAGACARASVFPEPDAPGESEARVRAWLAAAKAGANA